MSTGRQPPEDRDPEREPRGSRGEQEPREDPQLHQDPRLQEQDEATDETENPVIGAEGHPVYQEATMQGLQAGIDMEDETPEEAQMEGHPTPDRPGRAGP
jgi:hypothetical protein